MTKFLITLTIFFALTVSASAQDYATDKVKVYAGFINGSTDFPVLNNQGLNLAAQYKVYGYEGVKLEAVADFSAYLKSARLYVYTAGPQVSVDLFEGRLTPFARILFGATRYDEQTFFTHSIGGGVDVNVSRHFFVRPFQYDRQSIESAGQTINRIGVGLGFRFGAHRRRVSPLP